MDIQIQPFSVPAFQNIVTDGTPAQFLECLRAAIDQVFQGTHLIKDRATSTAILTGLIEHFISSFPRASDVPWSALTEKVALVDVTLEFLLRAGTRVEAIFSTSEEFSTLVFAHVLSLYTALDSWCDVDLSGETMEISPSQLQLKAMDALVQQLRVLGNQVMSAPEGSRHPPWSKMKVILYECIGVAEGKCQLVLSLYCMLKCVDLLQLAPSPEDKVDILLFQKPRIRSVEVRSSILDSSWHKLIIVTC